jgi:hypothetical protein
VACRDRCGGFVERRIQTGEGARVLGEGVARGVLLPIGMLAAEATRRTFPVSCSARYCNECSPELEPADAIAQGARRLEIGFRSIR